MGNYLSGVEQIAKILESLPLCQPGIAYQHDAAEADGWGSIIVSTDPPYYDNIGYADLSDFFYIWLRKSIGAIWPRTLTVTPRGGSGRPAKEARRSSAACPRSSPATLAVIVTMRCML